METINRHKINTLSYRFWSIKVPNEIHRYIANTPNTKTNNITMPLRKPKEALAQSWNCLDNINVLE